MALNAYLDMTGAQSGKIKGGVIQKGREGKILIIAADHQISIPRDPASGMATGKRMHKPFVIRKELDQSTPQLYTMLRNNEQITEWDLQFWAPNPMSATGGTGVETQNYTVRLTHARLVDIRFCMPNNKDPQLANFKEYEELTFVYEKIEWIWKLGNKTASDNW